MKALGDKIRAKELARAANVPTAPSSAGALANEEEAVKAANEIGYPVALKASAGGGGRGIRFAHNEATLRHLFKQAQREAEIAFQDGRLYMEKCFENFRHIEVQILGDMHGHIIHLNERECSVQRRRQKLIEESPSPGLSNALRQEVCQAAVRLAKEVGYYSAGTVEFMLDSQDKFYFLEVNTRIQVEHPVTEMVTGEDLVKWQLRIASGEALDLQQQQLSPRGHAIECRINAEDPEHNFRPCPGKIEAFVAPGGPGVRWDSHIYQGYDVPPTYDSLLGKLIVHRPTRAEAIATARRALSEFVIYPTKTTVGLCRDILTHQKFLRGEWETTYVEREMLGGAK
jgi:acetyl-CoA carboxylase biotin carboxylase subunit